MYDFWFALGTAIMEPALLTTIDQAGPVFNRVAKRVIQEPDAEGKLTAVSQNDTTAGLLEKAPTESVRSAMAGVITQKPGGPPVSIYTAGKFSQFMTVPATNFRETIADAKKIYDANATKAAQANPAAELSPGFPALLGLSMSDAVAAQKIKEGDPKLLAEFHVNPDPGSYERVLLNGFVNDSDNVRAKFLDSNWNDGCGGEQIAFWEGANERAIMH